MDLRFYVDQLAILQNQFNFLVGAIQGAETLSDVQKALADLSSIKLEGPIEQALDGKWAVALEPSDEQIQNNPNIFSEQDLVLRDDDGKVMLFDSMEEAQKEVNLNMDLLREMGFSGFRVFGGPA